MTIDLESLVLTLFNSLFETTPWQSFLKSLERKLSCQSCALLLRTPSLNDPGLLMSEKLGPEDSLSIVAAFHDSPFYDIPNGEIQALSQRRSEPFFGQNYTKFHDYCKRAQVVDLIALNLFDTEQGVSFRLRAIRSEDSVPFNDKEIAVVKALLPYLKSAVSIYARHVRQQRQLYISEETASQLGFGLIVLRSDGEIVTMNSFAESILQERKDFFVRQGRLHFADKEGELNLRRYLRLLEKQEEKGDCSFQVPCADIEESNWMLTLLRYADIPVEFRGDNTGTYSVILHRRTPISVEHISRLLDLTPAEAQLAKHLVQGDSLSEAAEKLGRSRSTVRVQLAAIFAKTGVHKQHQLISHILQAASRH